MAEEGDVKCPLPVIRHEWDEMGENKSSVLRPCGEAMYVAFDGWGVPYRYGDDDPWDIGEQEERIKIECSLGHVLMVCDIEDASEGYDKDIARAAYEMVANGVLWPGGAL